MVKFLIDNNIPKSVAVFLKKKRYDIKLVGDINPEMSDIEVLNLAKKDGRVIISNDKDFLNLSVKYYDVDMILFDYVSQKADVRIQALKKILSQLKSSFGLLILQ